MKRLIQLGRCLLIGGVSALLLIGCSGEPEPETKKAPTKYSLGGTIIGLKGDIALSVNGGEPMEFSATGADLDFTIADGLDDTLIYALTIVAKPTDQQCDFEGDNTGTINGADVTDIRIQCRSLFSISGSAEGLTGNLTVSLDNNDVGINTNNPNFTFANLLFDSDQYKLIIKNKPSTQSCAFSTTNFEGTIQGANVTGVKITCTTNTFTIGGTVTGLDAGVSLALTLNSESPQTFESSGNSFSFTFSKAVAAGATYSVAIPTSPDNYDCSVTNGNSTVNNSNISDIAVICTKQLFSISGTITGLINDDLQLSLNDGTPIDISGGRTSFDFSTKLPNNDGYQVDIVQQPDNSQLCAIDNASGTVSGGNVNNIAVRCYSWLENSTIVVEESEGSRGPFLGAFDITIDNTGMALVAWARYYSYGNSNYQETIYSRSYDPSTTSWGTSKSGFGTGLVKELSTFTTAIAKNNNDDAILVWDTEGTILAAHYDPASQDWQSPKRLDSSTENTTHDPQVVMDDNGNALMVWLQGGGNVLWYSRFLAEGDGDGDGNWSDAKRFRDVNATDATLAVNKAGFGMITWREEQDDGSFKLLALDFNLAREDLLFDQKNVKTLDTGLNEYSQHQVAINDNGDARAVWRRSDSKDLYTKAYGQLTDWEEDATNLTDSEGEPLTNARRPQLGLDNQGRAVVAWWQADGDDQGNSLLERVRVRTYRPDDGWSEPLVLGSGIDEDRPPVLAMNAKGQTLVSWVTKVTTADQERAYKVNSLAYSPDDGGWSNSATDRSVFSQQYAIPDNLKVVIDEDGRGVLLFRLEHKQLNQASLRAYEFH